jgi:hypothetical protein
MYELFATMLDFVHLTTRRREGQAWSDLCGAPSQQIPPLGRLPAEVYSV